MWIAKINPQKYCNWFSLQYLQPLDIKIIDFLVTECDSKCRNYFKNLVIISKFETTFSGITNDSKDPSIDTFRSTTLPILKQFGVPAEGLDLKIESRGVAPKGGGEVLLSVPMVPNSLKVSFFSFTSLFCILRAAK